MLFLITRIEATGLELYALWLQFAPAIHYATAPLMMIEENLSRTYWLDIFKLCCKILF